MTVLFILMMIVGSYLTVAANTAKYAYWKDYALQFKKPDMKEVSVGGLLWPVVFMMEPRYIKSLITPTMWLDPEFRRLYPSVKREKELDRERELEVRTHQHQRERTLARQQALLADKREELEFERRKKYLERDIDTANQNLHEDIPVQLIEGVTYDQYMRGEVPKQIEGGHKRPASWDVDQDEMSRRAKIGNIRPDSDGDIYCSTHEHWVKPYVAMNNPKCFT